MDTEHRQIVKLGSGAHKTLNRTIHSRMRDYLYELKHNDELETVILTIGDGTAVSVRK